MVWPGNTPPTLVVEPVEYVGDEDKQGEIRLTVSDDRTAPELLRVRAFALDPDLIPFTNVTLTSTGATRVIRFRALTNLFGSTEMMILTTDAAGSTTTNVVPITINNVNDAPKIATILNQFSNGPGDPLTVAFTVSDVDDAASGLDVSAASSNTAILPDTNLSLGGSGANRTLTLFTTSSAPAEVGVTVTVKDPAGATASTVFAVMFTNRIFKRIETPFVGVRSGAMAWGDFDDDRDLDLVLSGDGATSSLLYTNNGTGVFAKAPVALPGPNAPKWLDLDRDGDLDLLLSDGPTFFKNEQGALAQAPTSVPNSSSGVWGDFDGDGDLDVVAADFTAGIARPHFYVNQAGTYLPKVAPFSGTDAYPIAFEDFDLDGRPDLNMAVLTSTWTKALYLQQPLGTFAKVATPWPGELLVWADFDNDGVPDAIVNTEPHSFRNTVTFFKNEGFVFPGAGSVIAVDIFPNLASAADYDNDGFLDLVVNGYRVDGSGQYATRLFHNEGDGTFREVQHPFEYKDSITFSWADVDNDGDLDMVMTAQPPNGAYVSAIFRNDQPTPNQLPTAPSGLRATPANGGVRLEWNASADANQTGGLTYNVALGTAPGKWDIITPLSLADGRRKVVEKGNAGWALTRQMRGLEAGRTYYFAVQAVDNSFAGSPFSETQSFTYVSVPQLVAPAVVNGQFQFTLLAEAGPTYVVEASADLLAWSEISRVTDPAQMVKMAVASGARFVRVRAL